LKRNNDESAVIRLIQADNSALFHFDFGDYLINKRMYKRGTIGSN